MLPAPRHEFRGLFEATMVGRLRPDEAGTRGARRIARHRVESALEILGRKVPTDHSVHAARKELKKARATLRLVRDALGSSTYKKENAALRDASRPLSELRDGQVLLDALSSLVKHYGARAASLPLRKFERVLDRRRRELRESVLKSPGALNGARKTLRAVRSRSEHWNVGRHGWSVLGPGLKRTYSQGRRAFTRARARRSDASLHEWRKQIQYFWHQLQLFEPLESRRLAGLVEQIHKVADLLGDDHDLAVLRDRAVEARESFPDAATHREFIELIERCRVGLQDQALQIGRRLYKEPPATFTARLGRNWRDWHHSRGRRSSVALT
jgi:CHAD domain-containing protein